ncbi:MAG: hypothetical protein MUF51_01320 [Vicinamibacteria bacterium]|nr:hypothetical protein [Vicinamibacteria bacterium]
MASTIGVGAGWFADEAWMATAVEITNVHKSVRVIGIGPSFMFNMG